MNTKAPQLLMLAALIVILSGCSTAYRNGQACKQKMVETYPADQPTLSYSIPRTSHRGTRVVVEATSKAKYPAPIGNTPLKVRTYDAPAAVECTFDDEKLMTFQWLVPATFSKAGNASKALVEPPPVEEPMQPTGQPGYYPGTPLILPGRN